MRITRLWFGVWLMAAVCVGCGDGKDGETCAVKDSDTNDWDATFSTDRFRVKINTIVNELVGEYPYALINEKPVAVTISKGEGLPYVLRDADCHITDQVAVPLVVSFTRNGETLRLDVNGTIVYDSNLFTGLRGDVWVYAEIDDFGVLKEVLSHDQQGREPQQGTFFLDAPSGHVIEGSIDFVYGKKGEKPPKNGKEVERHTVPVDLDGCSIKEQVDWDGVHQDVATYFESIEDQPMHYHMHTVTKENDQSMPVTITISRLAGEKIKQSTSENPECRRYASMKGSVRFNFGGSEWQQDIDLRLAESTVWFSGVFTEVERMNSAMFEYFGERVLPPVGDDESFIDFSTAPRDFYGLTASGILLLGLETSNSEEPATGWIFSLVEDE